MHKSQLGAIIIDCQTETLPEQAVSIRLKPQGAGVSLNKREEQEMLTRIKGNIN